MWKLSKLMSITLLTLVLCVPLLFISCSDNDDEHDKAEYAPGQIPGLGNAEGELTGKPFTLPNGIELEGEIKGYSNYTRGEIDKKDLKPEALIPDWFVGKTRSEVEILGCGVLVRLSFSLRNTTNTDIDVEFPAGFITRSLSSYYQNGILLKKVKVTVPANDSHLLVLHMHCGNLFKSSPSSLSIYEWSVITNASLILDLCNRLAGKKINYEEFKPSEIYTYTEQSLEIQDILWNITDYEGMTEDDIEYINSLPNSN